MEIGYGGGGGGGGGGGVAAIDMTRARMLHQIILVQEKQSTVLDNGISFTDSE